MIDTTNQLLVDPVRRDHRQSRTSRETVFVHIVLPAFNEAGALPQLLDSIHFTMSRAEQPYRVIVVDDGSSDGTAAVARQAAANMPVELIIHRRNRGLGVAMRSGIDEALAGCQPHDCVVTMDADNTHPPEQIIEMLDKINEGHNLVVASLFHQETKLVGLPAYRKSLSLAGLWVFRLVFPIRGIRCYTSGYRAIRADLLRAANDHYGDRFISEQGFTATADLLLKLRRFPLRAVEVPLVLRYDRRVGQSKMPVLRTIWQTVSLIVRRRLLG